MATDNPLPTAHQSRDFADAMLARLRARRGSKAVLADLETNCHHFIASPVAAALLGTEVAARPRCAPLRPLGLVCPLPADESQAQVVARALRQESFVVEGPPGTGKSQTILNVVAAVVAARGTVLIVTDNPAARRALEERLESTGLRSVCTILGDDDALRSEIASPPSHRSAEATQEWRHLETVCTDLERQVEAHRQAVHGPTPLRASMFEAWCRRESEARQPPRGPALEIPAAVVSDAAASKTVTRSIEGAVSIDSASLRSLRPWLIAGDSLLEPDAVAAVSETLRLLGDGLERVEALDRSARAVIDAVASPSEFDVAARLLDLARAGVPLEPSSDSASFAARRLDLALAEMAAAQASVANLPAQLLCGLLEHISTLLPVGLEALSGPARGRSARRRFLDQLDAIGCDPSERSTTEWVAVLQCVATASERASRAWEVFPRWVRSSVEPSPALLVDLDVVGDLVGSLAEAAKLRRSPCARVVQDGLAAGWRPSEAMCTRAAHLASAWRRLEAAAGPSSGTLARWRGTRSFVKAWTDSQEVWSTTPNPRMEIRRAAALWRELSPLAEAGMESTVDELLAGSLLPADLPDSFRRGKVRTVGHQLLDGSSYITDFDASELDRILCRLSTTREAQRSLAVRVACEAAESREPNRAELLEHLRRATDPYVVNEVDRAGLATHLIRGFPCVIATPDTVATCLPPVVSFDVTIIDEASQMPVERAIGAIGRSRSAIVFGDSAQMPPKSCFVSSDAVIGGRTLLQACLQEGLPSAQLTVHYRSKRGGLFDFSNTYFYEGRLSSIPRPVGPTDTPTPAVSLRRVDGEFIREGPPALRRTNPAEAEAVVGDVMQRVDAGQRSILILTANVAQQRLIRELLEAVMSPSLASALNESSGNGVLVRNLENAQGLERDVVLLSLGYSPVATGDYEANPAFPLRFGPLNTRGGERRLNVAVTRARNEVIVFASFDPEDLRVGPSTPRGVRLLADYLFMARDGAGQTLRVRRSETEAPFRSALAAALRSRGFDVPCGTEDPMSPWLSVRLSSGESGVVLLDDDAWARSDNPGARDVHLLQTLANGGWGPIARVWLPAWIRDPECVLDRLSGFFSGGGAAV